ncbi:MAG: family 43 glycosylhydrolase [Lachnospiraceae bacterium]|nr:family 43 glycosylhydrolase [Lachnospiraceae bacterium]MCI1398967.1 family 43 glycosylhydrolase [Lachnospiraceae bacterium]MCI1424934.1 family 43 glycosylhydrolase [Lachnospiraceae bacterium]MCI1453617.1 family 43 glycosylhydrolase [Lachnospiraceae bacterium]
MKRQICNPYLPSWEYVPDGEPHLFGERVYVYGSHDRFGTPMFCLNDYVCWSAPADDLSDWRYEGVIYRRRQAPANRLGLRSLYAPDVCQGQDGRYYLYYAFDFLGRIGVAVCDTPAEQYEYYGTVHFADGHVWGTRSGEPFAFDPGVLAENGKVHLLSGFATKVPFPATRFHQLICRAGVMAELVPDMVTITKGPVELFPTKGRPGA